MINLSAVIKRWVTKPVAKSIDILNQYKTNVEVMNKQIASDNPKSISELKLKPVRPKGLIFSRDEDMARVNPYRYDSEYFAINCAYCTAAYDLRRRGYDVEADDYHNDAELDLTIPTLENIYSWYTHNYISLMKASDNKSERAIQEYYSKRFPGLRYFAVNGSDEKIAEIKAKILRYEPDNSRGHFILKWISGKSHSVVYEVTGSTIIFRDCQANKIVQFEEYMKLAESCWFFNTDRQDITENILACVKNKIDDTVNDSCQKTGSYALARMYQKNGYSVYTTKINDVDYYKVYLDKNGFQYILINIETCETQFVTFASHYI